MVEWFFGPNLSFYIQNGVNSLIQGLAMFFSPGLQIFFRSCGKLTFSNSEKKFLFWPLQVSNVQIKNRPIISLYANWDTSAIWLDKSSFPVNNRNGYTCREGIFDELLPTGNIVSLVKKCLLMTSLKRKSHCSKG